MKIFYDKNLLNKSQFVSEQFLLINEFPDSTLESNPDFAVNYKDWRVEIKEVVDIVDTPEAADFVVYHKKADSDLESFARKYYYKNVIAFFNDDSSVPLFDNNTVTTPNNLTIFRTSMYGQRAVYKALYQEEFAMPAWSADLLTPEDSSTIRFLESRPYKRKPVIGFCGAITDHVRLECIRALGECALAGNAYDTNFIIRDSFWGGKPHDKKLRSEYIANIQESDMVLCMRGAGNFSFRLYECLSLGRIPIIVDSDIVLPCSNIGIWDRFPRVDASCSNFPGSIAPALMKFWHNPDTAMNYDILQMYARRCYDQYLSPPGFAKYIDSRMYLLR